MMTQHGDVSGENQGHVKLHSDSNGADAADCGARASSNVDDAAGIHHGQTHRSTGVTVIVGHAGFFEFFHNKSPLGVCYLGSTFLDILQSRHSSTNRRMNVLEN